MERNVETTCRISTLACGGDVNVTYIAKRRINTGEKVRLVECLKISSHLGSAGERAIQMLQGETRSIMRAVTNIRGAQLGAGLAVAERRKTMLSGKAVISGDVSF